MKRSIAAKWPLPPFRCERCGLPSYGYCMNCFHFVAQFTEQERAMKRIRVPEGVIEAGVIAVRSYCAAHGYVGDDGRISDAWLGVVPEVVGAVLRHLSEHPQVPTDEQLMSLQNAFSRDFPEGERQKLIAVEWQRRCFVQEEPEIPAEIEDLIWKPHGTYISDEQLKIVESQCSRHNDALSEAYRRGLRKGDQK